MRQYVVAANYDLVEWPTTEFQGIFGRFLQPDLRLNIAILAGVATRCPGGKGGAIAQAFFQEPGVVVDRMRVDQIDGLAQNLFPCGSSQDGIGNANRLARNLGRLDVLPLSRRSLSCLRITPSGQRPFAIPGLFGVGHTAPPRVRKCCPWPPE